MASRWCGVGVFGLLLLLGCSEEERAARPPSQGGGGVPSSGGRPDSGTAVPGDAGMPPDSGLSPDSGLMVTDAGGSAPLAVECRSFEPVMFVVEDPEVEPVATSTSPSDFAISRALVAWDDSDCSNPALRIELSDGRCPAGRGHALVFWVDAGAIESGSLVLGQNSIQPAPDDDDVQIRYFRPTRLSPSGEWGTCTGASGVLDLRGEAPSTRAFAQWRGSFQLDLTACDGTGAALQQLVGTFNVQTRRALDEVCPER